MRVRLLGSLVVTGVLLGLAGAADSPGIVHGPLYDSEVCTGYRVASGFVVVPLDSDAPAARVAARVASFWNVSVALRGVMPLADALAVPNATVLLHSGAFFTLNGPRSGLACSSRAIVASFDEVCDGTALHEVGHLLGYGHDDGGVMSRGYVADAEPCGYPTTARSWTTH